MDGRRRLTDPLARRTESGSPQVIQVLGNPDASGPFLCYSASVTTKIAPQQNMIDFLSSEKDKKAIQRSNLGSSDFKLNGSREDHADSFYKTMRPLAVLAQVFGLLPVIGVTGPNHSHLTFHWRDWRVAYHVFATVGVSSLLIFSCLLSFRFGFTYDRSASIVFFLCGASGYVLMLLVATDWPSFNSDYALVESQLSHYGYPKRQALLFKVLIAVFMTTALVEHVLARLTDFIRIIPCSTDRNSALSLLRAFFINNFYQVFSSIPYSPVLGFIIFYVNILSTVSWNFTDLFLALVGLSLSARFHQINQELMRVEAQEMPLSYWRTVREDYNALSVLTKRIDKRTQKLMLLSMGSNLYFICLQLLKSLNKRINTYQIIYFIWSFVFLILRALFVALCAAGVHDQSKGAKTVLFSVPHTSYCDETRRFLNQINTDDIGLTGSRFFTVTRGLVLTIAGTVVTYEIVLVQFNPDSGVDAWPTETNKTFCVAF